jgi:hypothetical protein
VMVFERHEPGVQVVRMQDGEGADFRADRECGEDESDGEREAGDNTRRNPKGSAHGRSLAARGNSRFFLHDM